MKRSLVIWEIVAWIVFFPVALVLLRAGRSGYGYTTPEGRIGALLLWYPERWRKRHGDGLSEVLRDTIDDDRDGLRVSLDVAREGVIERAHAFDPRQAVASALVTVGWIMFAGRASSPRRSRPSTDRSRGSSRATSRARRAGS